MADRVRLYNGETLDIQYETPDSVACRTLRHGHAGEAYHSHPIFLKTKLAREIQAYITCHGQGILWETKVTPEYTVPYGTIEREKLQ